MLVVHSESLHSLPAQTDPFVTLPRTPPRPPLASRRHTTTISAPSLVHLSRPLRSSPLAGPSIAAAHDGTFSDGDKVASEDKDKSRRRSLRFSLTSKVALTLNTSAHDLSSAKSPASESISSVSSVVSNSEPSPSKKMKRRSFGLPILTFPLVSSPSADTVDRNKTKTTSTASEHPPPVPPVPVWAQQGSHSAPSSPTSPSYLSPTYAVRSQPPSPVSGPSRNSSPTPSSRSASSSLHSSGKPFHRPPPSISRSPELNWLSQASAPRFSRLGLHGEGVVMPISAREARRRSTVDVRNKGKARDTSIPFPAPRTPSRTSVSSLASTRSLSTSHGSSVLAPAPFRLISPTSSQTSFASATSAGCETPSLTLSRTTSRGSLDVDEMGMLTSGSVELQVNGVPVGVIGLCADGVDEAKDKDRGRSVRVKLRESAEELSLPLPRRDAQSECIKSRRALAQLDSDGALKGEKVKRSGTIRRVWKQVVRSVSLRR
ncbi:hypothetical protein A0H81_13658 [Grifola frondosa]|uniref:Uncharacterized protein n=1 Tax=Grifola frondosa TaxID=5627 RepID=A0A1C7LPL9_GRIFR|nr:hypothetical protein A0H81_13658 [Grifola frondosa]